MRHTLLLLALAGTLALAGCGDDDSSGNDTTPPGPPTEFAAVRNGDSVEVAWTMPSDADLEGALLLRRPDEEPATAPTDGQPYTVGEVVGSAEVVFVGHSTSTAYIDTPPASGRWCYRVYAFDGAYNYASSAGRCVDFQDSDNTPPTFGGLASATGVSNTQVELTWEAASDDQTDASAIVYDVYQAETESGLSYATPTYSTGAGVTSFTVFGLSPGTPYWFVVRARDLAGNQDANQLARSATTLSSADQTSPTFAGLTGATAVSTSRIDLAWNAASDDTSAAGAIVYDIYQATASGGQSYGAPTYTTAGGATSFPVTGLSPGTTYYFVVRARDEAGNQDTNTAERFATTTASGDVTPPTFAGLVTADAVSDTKILLGWADGSDNVTATGSLVYDIYQATTSGGQSFTTPTYTTPAGATSYLVSNLTPNTTYYFVVRARDEAGNSDTNTVQRDAATLSGPDTTAPNFTGVQSATAASSAAIDLTWTAAADNVTPASSIVYDIYWATASGAQSFAVPGASSPPGATSYPVTGLAPDTEYFFVVRARDLAGNRDVNLVERSATTDVTDTTPPLIESDNFATGGALVSGTTAFVASVTFSEPVTGVNATNITIDQGATLGSFSTSDNLTWNFTASGLQDGTRYTVSFTSGVQDASGNGLSATVREIYVAASVLYVRPGGAGVQNGTSPANALPLVSQALSIAAAGTDIYVQGGTYADSITVKAGVNIYGGYDASFTVRDPAGNESLLSQSAFDTTVLVDSAVTTDTIIDGMAFTNTITGSDRAVLRITGGGGVTVRKSRLFLGSVGCNTQMVIDATSGTGNSLVLEHSTVTGGGLASHYCSRSTYGIYVDSADANVRLDGNVITMGPNQCTSASYNYYFYAVRVNGHTVEIVNNVIDGGGGGGNYGRSTGVYHYTNSAFRKLVITNNTISGGAGLSYRYAVNLGGTINTLHDIRIVNNILFTGNGGSGSYAIYRNGTAGHLANVENNMFTDAAVYLHAGTDYTTISSMETYLQGTGTTASFNKNVADVADLYFEDYANGDWRPSTSSPLGLTEGGRDTSAQAYGTVTTDLAGNPRTSLYSIGAYELD